MAGKPGRSALPIIGSTIAKLDWGAWWPYGRALLRLCPLSSVPKAPMARSRPSIQKRIREKIKAEKRLLKSQRKAERAEIEGDGDNDGQAVDPDVDPDIAHIVPGPQKPLW